MLGILNNTEIEEVIASQTLGRLGCSKDGKIYLVPLTYAYDGKTIIIHSKSGMKIDFMRLNNEVCFEIEELYHMSNWKTVILWGTFEEIVDPSERKTALQILHQRKLPVVSSELCHLSPQWPFEPDDINSIEGVVFRINITEKSGRFEKPESNMSGKVTTPYKSPELN